MSYRVSMRERVGQVQPYTVTFHHILSHGYIAVGQVGDIGSSPSCEVAVLGKSKGDSGMTLYSPAQGKSVF